MRTEKLVAEAVRVRESRGEEGGLSHLEAATKQRLAKSEKTLYVL
jgi:hypothetical protein